MKRLYIIFLVAILLSWTACTNIEVDPRSSADSDRTFADPASYKAFVAKIYAGLATTGQQGPTGSPDIKGLDEGASQYLRAYWNQQELSTDEAVIGWNDGTIKDFHHHAWTSTDIFNTGLYSRVFFQVTMANEFLRETTESKLTERGVNDVLKADIQQYRTEARFLRALSYWHGLDLFRNIPLFTETEAIGAEAVPPSQVPSSEMFGFIETELKAIESMLPAPKTGEYGRVDQGAVWMLLAKLYLNAEVYISGNKYTECLTYCNKIITSGAYGINTNYQNNFLADNHTSGEVIFPITFDGERTRTNGGTTFLIHASVGGDMDAGSFGINGGWWGLRTTSSLVDLFPDVDGTSDSRAIFWTGIDSNPHTKSIEDVSNFFSGYAVPKYQNVTSGGSTGADLQFTDTDFPMFRLADVYLMYAEAVLRGGTGGDAGTALGYVNALRERAYRDTSGNITGTELTLDFLLDERARELYWEGHRRTDLVRFNQFTENGVWPWKGGIQDGKTTESFRNIYPVPAAERLANPSLRQNTGY